MSRKSHCIMGIFLFFLLNLSLGCSAKIIKNIEVAPDKYAELKDVSVTIIPHESATVRMKFKSQVKLDTLYSKSRIFSAQNVHFSEDSLSWFWGPAIIYSLPLTNVNSIQFIGVWDDELGPVERSTIMSNLVTNRRSELPFLYGVLGAIIGLYPSIGLGALVDPDFPTIFGDGGELGEAVFYSAWIGSIIGGAILGHRNGEIYDQKMAIEHLRELSTPGNGKRNERRQKRISFSYNLGGFPTGPYDEIEKAMISSGWNQSSSCIFFCTGSISYPRSNKGAGQTFNLNYKLTNGNSLGLIYSVSNIGSTTGHQRDLSTYYLTIDYSVRQIATIYSIQFNNVQIGLGPAFYSIQLWDEHRGRSEPVQQHNKVGLLFDGSISIPADSHLYLELKAQYRLTGKVEIGPFQETGFYFDDGEFITTYKEFPSSKVNYDHIFIGLGLGVRF